MAEHLAFYFAELHTSLELDARRRMVFGISESCDVDLRRYLPAQAIRTISRRHFEITFIPLEGYLITDLCSLNGTRVNGQLLRPGEPRFLRNGDTVMLAENPNFVLTLVEDPSTATELLAPADGREFDMNLNTGPVPGQLYLAENDHFVLDSTHIPRQHLTVLEEKLLRYLYEQAGRVCTYDELVRNVWGYARYDEVLDNTVAKTTSNLRKKLDEISPGAGVRHIRTVRGRGLTCIPV